MPPYRDPLTAARARTRALEAEVAELRSRRRGHSSHAAALEAELADTTGQLYRASLPQLEQLEIARPCGESWHAMPGDDRVRHCGVCCNRVYNISALTREQALELVFGSPTPVCVRLYRRADGTVMTDDCRQAARGAIRLGILVGFPLLVLLALMLVAALDADRGRLVMGAVPADADPAGETPLDVAAPALHGEAPAAD